MRPRLLLAAVFLLAGAVVNVAVAWGLAICLYGYRSEDTGWQAHETKWRRKVGCNYELGRVIVFSHRHIPPGETFSSETLDGMSHPLLPRYWLGMRHRFYQDGAGSAIYFVGEGWGWPCKAMWYDYAFPNPTQPIIKNAVPLATKLDRRTPSGIPLRLVADGFLINTLFYAVVLWLLIPGPFVLRRFIRVRRGLCPACAYPRGESVVCSECGKALPGRAEVAT